MYSLDLRASRREDVRQADVRACYEREQVAGVAHHPLRGKPATRAARKRVPASEAPRTSGACHECGAPVVDDGELIGPCRRCGKSFCSRKCEHKGWRPGGFGCSGVIARRDDFVRLHGSTFWQACDANSDAAMDAVERQAEMIERNIAAAQARGVVCE